VPAAAVIPALIAYIKVVAVEKLVVGLVDVKKRRKTVTVFLFFCKFGLVSNFWKSVLTCTSKSCRMLAFVL